MAPVVAWVTSLLLPLRRSPRTSLIVYVSSTFCFDMSAAVTAPRLMKGTATDFFAPEGPMSSARPFPPERAFWKRNWKVRSSIASPSLSTWIS